MLSLLYTNLPLKCLQYLSYRTFCLLKTPHCLAILIVNVSRLLQHCARPKRRWPNLRARHKSGVTHMMVHNVLWCNIVTTKVNMIYCSCSRKIRKIRAICFKKFTIPNVVDRSRLFWRRTATHFRCQCTTKGNVCRWKGEKFLSPTMTFAFIMTLNLYNITSSDSWSVWFCTWDFPKMSY